MSYPTFPRQYVISVVSYQFWKSLKGKDVRHLSHNTAASLYTSDTNFIVLLGICSSLAATAVGRCPSVLPTSVTLLGRPNSPKCSDLFVTYRTLIIHIAFNLYYRKHVLTLVT
jgi:hypothetical protein